ncbi:2-phospho-L-lactate transferase [Kineobactrum salinum]|uniref:2-phospho-L-lactate transferase n=1 Tax=Kineobactrum salinum TaxID=2708301 RepID=A0A6C0U4X0_9GAMM|nr:2-phospho-L-lactate transferase [Kineobactrum salinum]QIB64494.1 2-phospho-L-lactate transferase [Kineobactrum salinum]
MRGTDASILALSGGVGGAKLCLGLADVLPPAALHIASNTADDFEHLGLTICPDIDTVLYTLAGVSNQRQGWGLEGESWQVLAALESLSADTWFRLGDRDLATHLWRTGQLAAGCSLSTLTAELARRLGVTARLYPMSDDRVSTVVHSDEGDLPFQHYFVRRQCQPRVGGFSFAGLAEARLQADIVALCRQQAVSGVIICPSNPFVSVAPILQLDGCWQLLRELRGPVLAVCPIVGGRAIKGPAAKMMAELALPVTALGVAEYYARHYPGLVDIFVIDHSDATLAADIQMLGMEVRVTATVMQTRADKQALAQDCLQQVLG